jgi:L-ascorbate metabolism protein UlaG (beta-lactamase superfamily)
MCVCVVTVCVDVKLHRINTQRINTSTQSSTHQHINIIITPMLRHNTNTSTHNNTTRQHINTITNTSTHQHSHHVHHDVNTSRKLKKSPIFLAPEPKVLDEKKKIQVVPKIETSKALRASDKKISLI